MTTERTTSAGQRHKKRPRTLAQAIDKVLAQRIVVLDGQGRRKRITKRVAIAARLIKSGLQGDSVSARLLLAFDAASPEQWDREPQLVIINHPQPALEALATPEPT